MSGDLLITGGDVLDVRTGVYSHVDVRMVDGVIEEIDDHVAAPDSVQRVDATGKYVIPGLIDCHVHATAFSADLGVNRLSFPTYIAAGAARILAGMLRRGFTTVRDVGGADAGLAAALSDGLIDGPTLHYGGPALSQTGGHGDFRGPADETVDAHVHGIGKVVDGVDGLRRAAREEIRRGAHHLKIMASGGVASPTDRVDSTQFSETEITAIVEEAAAADVYVAAHAYTSRAVERLARLGVRSIEHGNLADDDSLRLLADRGAFLVPTLVTYWALRAEGRDHGQTQASWEKTGAMFENGLAALERATRAGVTIAYGTDLLGGMHHHQNREFVIRGEVQPVLDVLRSATVHAAALLQREGEIGEIVPGARADMIVCAADPLGDPAVLGDPDRYFESVVHGGSIVA